MINNEPIFIQSNNERIELIGKDKEAFIADRYAIQAELELIETVRLEKETARASAINKLATMAGLTEEELNSII
jgi:hypothetical protein